MEHFIKNIEITNFKSIRHAEVKDCRRVNVFVGYPNVGKSNILEALSGFTYNSGSKPNFNDLCRYENSFTLFFNANVGASHISRVTVNDTLSLYYKFQSANQLVVKAGNQTRNLDTTYIEDIDVSKSSKNSFDYELSNGRITRSANYDKAPSLIVKKYEFIKKQNDSIQSDDLTLTVPFGENLPFIIEYSPELRKEIVSLFKAYNLKVLIDKGSNQIRVMKDINYEIIFSMPFFQTADTLQRLIFYKAAILTNKNSVLLLEEPESHMFPPYISKMTGDIIYDENGNQFFIATHSPYVLGDLIRDVEPEELSVYIVDYDVTKGETIIHRMNEEEVNEAYQFGHDFFMNINNFTPTTQHEQV